MYGAVRRYKFVHSYCHVCVGWLRLLFVLLCCWKGMRECVFNIFGVLDVWCGCIVMRRFYDYDFSWKLLWTIFNIYTLPHFRMHCNEEILRIRLFVKIALNYLSYTHSSTFSSLGFSSSCAVVGGLPCHLRMCLSSFNTTHSSFRFRLGKACWEMRFDLKSSL